MPKGYWVSSYRTISDPAKLAAYGELAGVAVRAGGGRTIVRGGRVVAHDAGIAERTVVVEFDSFEQAVATHESEAYQKALKAEGYGDITTELLPAPDFYFAEDYHQQYLAKNPGGYCGIGGTGVTCPIGVGVDA